MNVESCRRIDGYKELEGEASKFRGRALVTFDVGHLLEAQTIVWLEQAGFTLVECDWLKFHEMGMAFMRLAGFSAYPSEPQKCPSYAYRPADDVPPVMCHVDAVLRLPDSDECIIMEHKAISHWSFEGAEEGKFPAGRVRQLHRYMLSECGEKYNIKRGVLLQINKNTGAYYEMWWRNDNGFMVLEDVFSTRLGNEPLYIRTNEKHREISIKYIKQQDASRYKYVRSFTDKEELPPRDKVFGQDYECSSLYCRYYDHCFSTYESPRQERVSEPPPKVLDRIEALLYDDSLRLEKDRESRYIKRKMLGDSHELIQAMREAGVQSIEHKGKLISIVQKDSEIEGLPTKKETIVIQKQNGR